MSVGVATVAEGHSVALGYESEASGYTSWAQGYYAAARCVLGALGRRELLQGEQFAVAKLVADNYITTLQLLLDAAQRHEQHERHERREAAREPSGGAARAQRAAAPARAQRARQRGATTTTNGGRGGPSGGDDLEAGGGDSPGTVAGGGNATAEDARRPGSRAPLRARGRAFARGSRACAAGAPRSGRPRARRRAERLTLVTSGDARGGRRGNSARRRARRLARSLPRRARVRSSSRRGRGDGGEADADGATDAPACGVRLTFDADAVIGVAGAGGRRARRLNRLMLGGDTSRSSTRPPRASRTRSPAAVERGRGGVPRIEEAALLDRSRLEVRGGCAPLPGRVDRRGLQSSARRAVAQDLERVDAGVVALVAERETMDERVATLGARCAAGGRPALAALSAAAGGGAARSTGELAQLATAGLSALAVVRRRRRWLVGWRADARCVRDVRLH